MAETGAGVQVQDAATRGTLEVKDRAIERIVEATALDVRGVAPSGATTGVIGSALGRAYPRVDCDVAGKRVRVRVEVVTVWPRPAREVAAAVRDLVTERLLTLADLQVDTVEVHVAAVVRSTTPERRRVQ